MSANNVNGLSDERLQEIVDLVTQVGEEIPDSSDDVDDDVLSIGLTPEEEAVAKMTTYAGVGTIVHYLKLEDLPLSTRRTAVSVVVRSMAYSIRTSILTMRELREKDQE